MMQRLAYLSLTLLSLLLAQGALGQSGEASQSGVVVRGRVIRTPIPGTPPGPRIGLSGKLPFGNVASAIQPDGSFEFKGVPPGEYTISLSPTPLSSMLIEVTVPGDGLVGLEIVVPGHRAILGRAEVEDGGPAPIFGIFLDAAEGATFQPNSIIHAIAHAVPIEVQADGSMAALVPFGEYKTQLMNVPNGYALRSGMFGQADLTMSFLKITPSTSDRLSMKFVTASNIPWVRVGGRVVTPGNAPATNVDVVMLAGPVSLSTKVNSDGSFNFPKVLPGEYSARTAPFGFGAGGTEVVVENRDLVAVEVPAPRDVRLEGRVVVEGGAPIPRIALVFKGVDPAHPSGLGVNVMPSLARDGTFRTLAGEGQFRFGVDQYPAGYRLKSLKYGEVDLSKDLLLMDGTGSKQLVATFEVVAAEQWTKVTGRVQGTLRPEAGNPPRVLLAGPVLAESGIDANGAFSFLAPRGNYSLRAVPGPPIASVRNIVVSGPAVNADVVIRRQAEASVRVVMDDASPLPDLARVNIAARRANDVFRTGIQPDGRFRLTVAEGEQRIEVLGLPRGYKVRSIVMGTTNLMNQPLKLEGPEFPSTFDILVTLEPDRLSPR